MNGIINFLKPPGMTSHDVINFVRRTTGIKKVGHTGTLDPGAAGVLVVCMGQATRLSQFLIDDTKEYRAEITFGLATSTGDSFGQVTAQGNAAGLTEKTVRDSLTVFTGEISQIPPMTSAIKQQGKKLYQLARDGIVVDRPARKVTIYSLEYIWGTGWGSTRPRALLHLRCSKGTYVRTLCEDLGSYLGCGAHMSFLVRTRAGIFNISDSATLEEIKAAAIECKLMDKVIPMEKALFGLPVVTVKNGAATAVASGSKLYQPGVYQMPENLSEGDLVQLVGPEGLLAVAETILDPEYQDRLVFKPVCVLQAQAGGN
ncbi:tRNA pseudouridine synthase B [Pelotomaculum schinkii]|uniref:tRNA pseudouridine synthase B n=1 Tax=Pelotomaculum schinkii TaxID=78350 RepID=A0A4Y7RDA5_9FIRM|nr:tRNA pseudouridine(55) synthase TruB [Pelotomaculum schinkii]TEB06749.1 tRNA pseudouridine synthase B [Pelotomaculum schinkii]